ncbi:hypothetical protein BVRB_4g096350 [Beta vulgaris subsp. vulgaris]|uniref:ACT domain-containing protein ACR n=1 Tax=Beta vulgaris subsp. vulgaris TaxID=3555 RepID=A0A0J8BAY2_BETVV|nr:hypothetical protein BVRB_4g096350 [Beta vulgaris subsp. vulgaris]
MLCNALLEAAIERRASDGLELELCIEDRVGLLSDITRIFRENRLAIQRAEISTKSGNAVDTFYVTDLTRNHVDPGTVDSIKQEIGQTILQIKHNSHQSPKPAQETTMSFMFGNFFKYPRLQKLKAK